MRVWKAGLLASLTLAMLSALPLSAGAENRNARIGINPWTPQAFLENTRGYAATNVGSIRIDLPWQQVEPTQGDLDWNDLDKLVEAAQSNNMSVLITLRAISSWGTHAPQHAHDQYHGASLPIDMNKWERFVSAMARRYRGRNVAYEIENEPNSPFWAGSMDDYLTLLKASYGAIMRSDPQARVVSAPLACHVVYNYRNAKAKQKEDQDFDTWQNAILATRAFNTIGVHDYYFPGEAVNGWTFDSYLGHVRSLARATGCKNCGIWITETGYVSRSQRAGTRTDPGSPENQARWARSAFREAFRQGAERVYWLYLTDHNVGRYFDSMGLLDDQGTPAPGICRNNAHAKFVPRATALSAATASSAAPRRLQRYTLSTIGQRSQGTARPRNIN